MKRAAVPARVCVVALCCALACKSTPDDVASSAGMSGMMSSGGVGGMIAGGAGGEGGEGDEGGAGMSWTPPVMNLELYDGPQRLSETGLYVDIAAGTLAEEVREYEPLGQLWSDGASKKRWLKLPANSVINTQNMDDWIFPIDTRVFKEFTRDGVRVETRMVWKRGANDWPMVAFLWNPEQTEAYAAPEGATDASGTPHDVPDANKCPLCHDGRSDRVLGVSALQLSRSQVTDGLLSDPPAAPLALPGDTASQEALAYLHANCGHCHNPELEGADRHISVYFWQTAAALGSLEDTVTYRSLVTSKASPLWIDAVLERMADRGGKQQMPPIATEDIDEEGIAKVRALMERLRADVPELPPRATGGTCSSTEQVFQIFETAGCRSSFCHGTAGGGLFWQNAQELEQAAIGVQAVGDGCGSVGISRVEAGDPLRSLLYLKLLPGPPCGVVMPPQLPMPQESIDAVRDWIMGCTATP